MGDLGHICPAGHSLISNHFTHIIITSVQGIYSYHTSLYSTCHVMQVATIVSDYAEVLLRCTDHWAHIIRLAADALPPNSWQATYSNHVDTTVIWMQNGSRFAKSIYRIASNNTHGRRGGRQSTDFFVLGGLFFSQSLLEKIVSKLNWSLFLRIQLTSQHWSSQCRTSYKPLSEPMVTQCTDAYIILHAPSYLKPRIRKVNIVINAFIFNISHKTYAFVLICICLIMSITLACFTWWIYHILQGCFCGTGAINHVIWIPSIFVTNCDQWPLLLTWFNFNPSMDM